MHAQKLMVIVQWYILLILVSVKPVDYHIYVQLHSINSRVVHVQKGNIY